MAVALIALFVALGGTAVAAKVLITSSSQIEDGAIKRRDLAKNVVNSSRVQDNSLDLDDLSNSTRGAIESGTQALEVFRAAGPENVGANQKATVATLRDIPPGAYAIFAKSVLTAPSQDGGILDPGVSIGGHCVLDAGGDTDESRALLGTPGANNPGGVSMQITRNYSDTGIAKVVCDVANAPWRASNTSIIALRVGASPRQVVDG
jgi:hypothetical protein